MLWVVVKYCLLRDWAGLSAVWYIRILVSSVAGLFAIRNENFVVGIFNVLRILYYRAGVSQLLLAANVRPSKHSFLSFFQNIESD
jgi:hypothetical protein